MGMKKILVMMVVMVLVGQSVLAVDKKPLIADRIVEEVIRIVLNEPTGELTEADLEEVLWLDLDRTQITDAGLKDVAKLQKLERLHMKVTRVTHAGLKELSK